MEILKDTGFQWWSAILLTLGLISLGMAKSCSNNQEMTKVCEKHCPSGFVYSNVGCLCYE